MPGTDKQPRGRPITYPWDKWLRIGSRHTLVRGIHFVCTTRSMACYIYNYARLYGIRVSIEQISESKLRIKPLRKIPNA